MELGRLSLSSLLPVKCAGAPTHLPLCCCGMAVGLVPRSLMASPAQPGTVAI